MIGWTSRVFVFDTNHVSEAQARLKRRGAGDECLMDAGEFVSLRLSHVSTCVVLPTAGWTLWEGYSDTAAVSVWWAWDRLQPGLVCLANPLGIEISATLTDASGLPLSKHGTVGAAGRLVAQTPWQDVVLDCMAEQRSSLTGREGECLRAAAAGMTAREAGTLLGVSAQTVSNCLSSAYQKLGVQTRGAAVREALRLAIVPFS